MNAPPPRIRFGLEDGLLLSAIVLLPWAFGGVEIWAYRTASLLIAAAASVSLRKRGWAGWGLEGRSSVWLLPAFLLAAWAAVQMIPMPRPLLGTLSPGADRIYSWAFPQRGDPVPTTLAVLEQQALDRVPEATPVAPPDAVAFEPEVGVPACFDGDWQTLSLQPSATLERLLWFSALLMAFLVVRQRVSDAGLYRVYRWTLFGLFGALALFALVQAQTWNGKIYWVRPLTGADRAFGPYVNPTNLAGVMEIGVPWMVGYAWSRLRSRGRDALREARFGAAVVAACVCGIAVLGAASKAGVVLVAVGLFALALVGAESWRARAAVALVAVTLAVLSPWMLSTTRLGERVDEYLSQASATELGEGRVTVWRSGLDMLVDFPMTGVGFGAFREVFPRYMPAGAPRWWDQAHNDYLEVLIDGGLIAGLLILWLAWGYARRVWGRLAGSGQRAALGRAGLTIGLLALTAHAFIDFNHQIPANALLYVAGCGLLLPLANRERDLVEEP